MRRGGAKRRRGGSSLPAKEGGTDRASDTGRHPVGEAPCIRPDEGVPHRFGGGFPCGALYPQAADAPFPGGSPGVHPCGTAGRPESRGLDRRHFLGATARAGARSFARTPPAPGQDGVLLHARAATRRRPRADRRRPPPLCPRPGSARRPAPVNPEDHPCNPRNRPRSSRRRRRRESHPDRRATRRGGRTWIPDTTNASQRSFQAARRGPPRPCGSSRRSPTIRRKRANSTP